MRNRPFHELTRRQREGGPFIDQAPQARLWGLISLFLAFAAVIIWRLYDIQSADAPQYIAAWEQTSESLESLPARDGRILTSDGRVLAFDRPRFDLALHYRWLEEPPQTEWLDSQARLLLKPIERRDQHRLAKARETILHRRETLHVAIAQLAGVPLSTLRENFREVQARVERIHANVEGRLAKREATAAPESHAEPDTDWAEQAWNRLANALTTPPKRPHRGPLVITEQLEPHVVVTDLSLSAVTTIEASPARFPGVEIQRSSHRVYPAGTLAAHIVGARTEVSGEELSQLNELVTNTDFLEYAAGDRVGRNGIEQAYEDRLRGRRGIRRVVRDRRGQIVRTDVLRQPDDGQDVVLSFASGLQERAEALLDAALLPPQATETDDEPTGDADPTPAAAPPQGGCIVAIDVRDGRVITAAAAPRFDANLIVDHDPDAWNTTISDARQPFFPRVTQMTIPPGSVFKALTAIAMIESGLIDPDAPFACQGYLDEPDRNRCLVYRHYGVGHGDVKLGDALCRSCNVYFFDAARRMGPEAIHDWAAKFGLGRPTEVDLPGERGGQLPDPHGTSGPWYPGTTLQLAIGQASLAVTPLQVARMMAAVANDGYLVTPTLVRPEGGADRSSSRPVQLAAYEDRPRGRVVRRRIAGLSAGTLARVRAGLRMVVEDEHGTGKRVRTDRVSVAGKTGTAEVGGGKPDHAWFAGYVPAGEPRVAFVVVLEHGGSGGRVAGPVAHDFVEALLDAGIVRPDR